MGDTQLTPEQLRIRALERCVLMLALDADNKHTDPIVRSLERARENSSFAETERPEPAVVWETGTGLPKDAAEALRVAHNALEQTVLLIERLSMHDSKRVRAGQGSSDLKLVARIVRQAWAETTCALRRHKVDE